MGPGRLAEHSRLSENNTLPHLEKGFRTLRKVGPTETKITLLSIKSRTLRTPATGDLGELGEALS